MPVTTSVTTSRPARFTTPLGTYEYRHVGVRLLGGYAPLDLGHGQTALVATPEKALLDLVYLEPGAHRPAYLAELRLQALDRVDAEALTREADRFARPKIRDAVERILRLARADAAEYETLAG